MVFGVRWLHRSLLLEVSQLLLLIISGQSASGKSTLLPRLARRYGWPYVSKDECKECLFDALGWSDRAFSQRIGGASYDLLLLMAEKLMQTQSPFILETNFTPRFAAELRNLIDRYRYASLVIHCTAERTVLLERFRRRSTDGSRHPGHQDKENMVQWETALLAQDADPPEVLGEVLLFDTTTISDFMYMGLWSELDSRVKSLKTQRPR